MSKEQEALDYHAKGRPGKIEITSTKPCITSRDLSLAYSPGVAVPCVHIAKNEDDVYRYTAKGNLVAVITNGTAVLGLGDIGPLAAKPVMEGKGVLFKKFADIDVFDIELNAPTAQEVIQACKFLEPTFGGINLEDIKAPECFEIEETLKRELNIPVFHDDQHGTAVITAAAVMNAVELIDKKIEDMKFVFSGAGAAAFACANMLLAIGVRRENVLMCDSKGVIHNGRTDLNEYKKRYSRETKLRTLAEALDGADAFVGVSVAGQVSQDMVKKMARDPLVFAMANPEPEILPSAVHEVRPDAICATGRSDFPNQVNNVLCFPFIFRGALDVQARQINEEMKLAAAQALAALAKEPVPDLVTSAYGGNRFSFGRDYLIPKAFDPRALVWVAMAVAKAAVESGVARKPIEDYDAYRERLEQIRGNRFMYIMRTIKNVIQKRADESKFLPKIVYPEGENERILKACQIVMEEKIAQPVLLGKREEIQEQIKKLKLDILKNVEIIDPRSSNRADDYAAEFARKRQRKGISPKIAVKYMRQRNFFGPMMVEMGDADAVINGITQSYPEAIRPMVMTIGAKPGQRLAGIYIMNCKSRIVFFADTTVNIDIGPEELAHVAIETSNLARDFLQSEPRVAMLSYSNFGSAPSPMNDRVRRAVEIVRARRPDLVIDGEMQVDAALVPEITEEFFPFSSIQGDANVLIFPDLASANISYKLLLRLGGAEAIGPILIGMNKPVNVLQSASTVQDVVSMTTITAMKVQSEREGKKFA